MFGIPLWVIQLIIAVLKAAGFTNWAENLSLKVISKTAKALSNLKSYHAEADFPSSPLMQTNQRNFVTGQGQEPKP